MDDLDIPTMTLTRLRGMPMTAVTLPARITWLVAIVSLIAATAVPPVTAQTSTPPEHESEPGFETFGALPWEEPGGAMPYLVWEVTDGDTFRVIETEEEGDPDPWWEPVRMIGIDAPEKDGPYTEEECYGGEADEFLSELLPEGTTVYLQVDNDDDIPDDREIEDDGMELDDNDRWLAHAYLSADGTDEYYLVSEILALGGYVDVRDYEGNTYFVDELENAEEIAREEDRGIWGNCGA